MSARGGYAVRVLAGLAALSGLAAGGSFAEAVTVSIRAEPTHRISRFIYGINGTTPPALKRKGIITVQRYGFGNPSTTYNWEINCSNACADWFYLNSKNEHDYLALARENGELGIESVVTVPCIGWVSRDDSSYSFSQRVYPMMQTWYEYAGKAEWAKKYEDTGRGAVQSGDDPNQVKKFDAMHPLPPECPVPDEALWRRAYYPTTTVAKPAGVPARHTGDEAVYLDEWLEEFGRLPGGPDAVGFYALDNEMELWTSTHYDLAPRPIGYEEFWRRILPHAEMIRRRAPRAKIVLPFSGWWHCSGRMGEFGDKGTGDFKRNGEFVPWLLARFREHERRTGRRLLDVLSVHCYPPGEISGAAGDGEIQRWRFEHLRALWDRSYYTRDWVGRGIREPLAHFSRMREWTDTYPGTLLGMTEYQFGGWAGADGKPHMSGLLTQAIVFGILARENVCLATGFGEAFHKMKDFPGLAALYEMHVRHFGDRYCPSTSSDENAVAAFSATGGDGFLYVILVNKDPERTLRVELALAGARVRDPACAYWRLKDASSGDLESGREELDPAKPAVEIPPYSVTSYRIRIERIRTRGRR